MVIGDPLSIDVREQDVFGRDCIVLEITSQSGNSLHARWERDSNRFHVAAALECLAIALRNTEI